MADNYVSLLDDDENRFTINSDAIYDPTTIKTDGKTIRKTEGIALSRIASPKSSNRPLVNRATVEMPDSTASTEEEELYSNLAAVRDSLVNMEARLKDEKPEPHTLDFPNLAWEAVKAGLAKERLSNEQLNTHIKEAEKIQKDIDLLLDFSAELTAHKDESKELSEKAKALLAQLKERGIDLWKGEGLNKEKISELKSLTSGQVDKLRSNLQIIFTTKIQFLIQAIGAIMESLKDIIRNNNKLISTINRLPGHA